MEVLTFIASVIALMAALLVIMYVVFMALCVWDELRKPKPYKQPRYERYAKAIATRIRRG